MTDIDKSNEKALEALHVAAGAISSMSGISFVTVDNDNDSGEIMFMANNENFVLRLERGEDDEDNTDTV